MAKNSGKQGTPECVSDALITFLMYFMMYFCTARWNLFVLYDNKAKMCLW